MTLPDEYKAVLFNYPVARYVTGPVTGYTYHVKPHTLSLDIDDKDVSPLVTQGARLIEEVDYLRYQGMLSKQL